MQTMNILCPQCSFALIVTNREILGRPARCPMCKHKFILRDPDPVSESTSSWESQSESEEDLLAKRTGTFNELAVDRGRIYITLKQIQLNHSAEESERFERWIADKTSIDAMSGSGFFLEDYDEWLSLGKPDGPESAR